MEWIAENWHWLSLALLVAANIFNAITRHVSEQSGAWKVLTALSESLSILSSAGVSPKLKAPGKSLAPEIRPKE